MKLPDFLKKGDTIGVCAPSMACRDVYIAKTKWAINCFEKLGYKVKYKDVIMCPMSTIRSASAQDRAEEFMQLYEDKDVKLIFSVAGGEYMMEILPYLDFDKLSQLPPKFFVGASDNTNLTFTLTTICDVASLYGYCFPVYGMKPWDKTAEDIHKFLMGKLKKFNSLKKYEITSFAKLPGHEYDGFNCTEKVEWKILSGHKKVSVSGIALGGCLDCLITLCGTKFDKVKEFVEKYKNEGIVWFLESCELNVLSQKRAFWQLKQAGWFDNAKAIIIGRPAVSEEIFGQDYLTANYEEFKDLNIPVVIDADFGHVSPALPICCGVKTKVVCNNGKGSIEYIL